MSAPELRQRREHQEPRNLHIVCIDLDKQFVHNCDLLTLVGKIVSIESSKCFFVQDDFSTTPLRVLCPFYHPAVGTQVCITGKRVDSFLLNALVAGPATPQAITLWNMLRISE
jgi:hypothetical protein